MFPELEDLPQWNHYIDNLITSTLSSDSDASFPQNLISNLQTKLKETFASFVGKHLTKVSEYKEAVASAENEREKLENEIHLLEEESEQLNEMSLNLLSQIGKMKKCLNQSDVLISVCRSEISQLKHDRKVLLNSLEQSISGNNNSAIKTLEQFHEALNSDEKESPFQRYSTPFTKRTKLNEELKLTKFDKVERSNTSVMQSARQPRHFSMFEGPLGNIARSLNDVNSPVMSSRANLENPQNSTMTDLEDNRDAFSEEEGEEFKEGSLIDDNLIENQNKKEMYDEDNEHFLDKGSKLRLRNKEVTGKDEGILTRTIMSELYHYKEPSDVKVEKEKIEFEGVDMSNSVFMKDSHGGDIKSPLIIQSQISEEIALTKALHVLHQKREEPLSGVLHKEEERDHKTVSVNSVGTQTEDFEKRKKPLIKWPWPRVNFDIFDSGAGHVILFFVALYILKKFVRKGKLIRVINLFLRGGMIR